MNVPNLESMIKRKVNITLDCIPYVFLFRFVFCIPEELYKELKFSK